MPKLNSSLQILKVSSKNGFIVVSQKGSHIQLRKSDQIVLTVIVPANKEEIPLGTFRSILLQSSLKEDDFNSKLSAQKAIFAAE